MRLSPEIAEHAVSGTTRPCADVFEQKHGQREIVIERAQQRRRQRHAAEVQMAAEAQPVSGMPPARQRSERSAMSRSASAAADISCASSARGSPRG